ncbi:SGNH/GDSL hydrolase family protein [Siminovitchia sediminis]|uniref:SGNH/GDSL hydrolase family protein n=1 Tax=Siminovitchia sediminis TaxID=1274353 RepID=A0ABW4KKI7_9BACI
MKKFAFMAIIFLLWCSGCASQNEHLSIHETAISKKPLPPSDFVPRDYIIVSVGDSLTQGVGSDEEFGGYIPFLKEDLEKLKGVNRAEFINHGKRGNRTDHLLKRLQEPAVKADIQRADLVIMTIGGNDVMQVFKDNLLGLEINKFIAAEKDYEKKLNAIFSLIRSYNEEAGIVLVGIYNPFIKWFSDIKEMDQIVNNWNRVSAETAESYPEALFVPVDDIFKDNEERLLYTDYFHPNTRGYELIAERIYDMLSAAELL